MAATLNISRADEAARIRNLTVACEIVRAGEQADGYAEALALVLAAGQPPSADEQAHRDAMWTLVEQANALHVRCYGYRR